MIQIWLGLWGLYSHWWWWSSSSSRFDDCIQGKGYFIIYDYNYDYDTPIYTLTIYSKMLITIAMPWRHQTQRWCCWYAIWSVTKTPVVDEFFFSINGSIEINKWNEKKIFHFFLITFINFFTDYYYSNNSTRIERSGFYPLKSKLLWNLICEKKSLNYFQEKDLQSNLSIKKKKNFSIRWWWFD